MSLTLTETEIHVWQANLVRSSNDCQQLAQTLSPDEKTRAERFRFPRDRDRFIVSRGTLRTLLGRYLNTSPDRVQFRYGDKGKPALAEPLASVGLEFNLSHSEDLMVCAVAYQQAIGIDLEYFRPVADLENLTQRFFTPQEHAAIHALEGDSCLRSFFQHWTCKEAVLKATGNGLMSLSAIEVCLQHDTAKLVRHDNASARAWSLQLFTPAPNYIGAVAMNAPERSLVYREC
ncbi:4'-phosphopantetheinyl transferase superfamily protein [Phormidium sp. FACHB-592]|uniref:4'-phosphopantetheinyl transferase superfamily protein n=1 Tax=Stenomitos frigidus AS-A4 TaxID=2933935 RepID=A0ABV0KGX3_9CYAN|nr:4'-phosphopantetheinyl transferase superfamily protein [Phormidium sp. FACHB-592]